MIPKSGYRFSEKIMLKTRWQSETPRHCALAAEFEQGVLVRPGRDLDAHRAGFAQRRGDLLGHAQMDRRIQRSLKQVRIARGIEKGLGRGPGEMQDGIDMDGERGGG